MKSLKNKFSRTFSRLYFNALKKKHPKQEALKQPKKIALAFLTLFAITSYSQTNLINVPEVWETDIWYGSNWGIVSQNTFTFNSNCLATEALGKFKDVGGSNMLENATFLTITYNANKLPVESINQLWDEDTGTWEDQLKTSFTYTGTNLIEYINYDWLDNDWEPSNKELNQYNASNLITENIKQTRDEENDVWLDISKTEYTYNANDTFNIVTSYTWNSSNGTWVNDLRETYTYSGNMVTSLKADKWNGSIWENDRLRNYTYDGNDFLIETLKTKWNGNAYDNDNRILRTNNNEGFPTEMINQTWFFGDWLNGSRDRRTYPDCSTLSTEKMATTDFKIYPNPAKNYVTINPKTNGIASIIDIHGRTITSVAIGNTSNTIDISKITNGLYLLVFQNKNKKEIKRLVVKK